MTKNSHGIFSSKPPQTVTSPANIVRGKNIKTTWISSSSSPLWMKLANMDHEAFHCTCLGNHSSTRISSRQSIILKPKTSDIPYFLQQMARYLTSLRGGYWKVEWIESFGVGGSSTLSFRVKQLKSSKESVWLGFSLKKPLKKSLRSGVNSQELR